MGYCTEDTRLFNTFLTNRQASLSFDGETEPIAPVFTSFLQGSPVSPILILLYLKPLFNILEKEHLGAKAPSYVNIVGSVVVGKREAAKCWRLEVMTFTTFRWGEVNTVLFENPKLDLVHYHNQRTTNHSEEAKVKLPNRTVIQTTIAQRWLGVWMDKKLNYKNHTGTRAVAVIGVIMTISQLANSEKGLSLHSLRQLYLPCITTIMDYTAEVWWKDHKIPIEPLIKIQNQGMGK